MSKAPSIIFHFRNATSRGHNIQEHQYLVNQTRHTRQWPPAGGSIVPRVYFHFIVPRSFNPAHWLPISPSISRGKYLIDFTPFAAARFPYCVWDLLTLGQPTLGRFWVCSCIVQCLIVFSSFFWIFSSTCSTLASLYSPRYNSNSTLFSYWTSLLNLDA